MLEAYRVLSFIDEIDHVTIRYRQGRGLDGEHAVRLLRSHAVWAEEPLPVLPADMDPVVLVQLLVELRERLIADFR